MDYTELALWGGWTISAILLAPKLWAALRGLFKVPAEVSADLDGFAQRRIDDRRRDQALVRLAEKADAILAQLQPNGGHSLADKVEKLAETVTAHVLDSAADSALLRNHVAETAPLVERYRQDLKERGEAQ